jgi:hypothetical protein
LIDIERISWIWEKDIATVAESEELARCSLGGFRTASVAEEAHGS